jgi:hypothetical protein
VTRERDRYRRASLREQASDALLGVWRNKGARSALAVLIGGLVLLRLVTPTPVSIAELATGDCVYLRAPGPANRDPDTVRVITSPEAFEFVSNGERASCSLSHSHEVSTVFPLSGDEYPGFQTLLTENVHRCEEAFAGYVDRPLDGSRLATTVAVPGPNAWADGARRGVCLVFNADGSFLGHHVRDSGE